MSRAKRGTIATRITLPLLVGQPERIDAVLDEAETRASFIRNAIEAKLNERESGQGSQAAE